MRRMLIFGFRSFLRILFLLLLLLTAHGNTWAASGKTRLAVIDFEQKAPQEFQGKQVGEIVAEWLITSLVNTGRFEVVERAQLQKILKEQQLGMTGMINQDTAAKVGELLGVKVIITGSVYPDWQHGRSQRPSDQRGRWFHSQGRENPGDGTRRHRKDDGYPGGFPQKGFSP